MQTSIIPSYWREDNELERQRWSLDVGSAYEEKRRLYPLSGRLTETSRIYPNTPAGTVFQYVRTRMTPAQFPVEVLWWDRDGHRKHCFAPHEIELSCPPPALQEVQV